MQLHDEGISEPSIVSKMIFFDTLMICCLLFFLNDFCLVLLFSNFAFEELGFTYEIFQIFFFCLFLCFVLVVIFIDEIIPQFRETWENREREREREREDTDLNSGSPINSGATFFFRGCCRTNAKRRCNGGNNEHKRWNQQKSGSRERERYPFLPIIV